MQFVMLPHMSGKIPLVSLTLRKALLFNEISSSDKFNGYLRIKNALKFKNENE